MKDKKITPLIAVLRSSVRGEGNRIYYKATCLLKLQGSRSVMDTDKIRIDVPVRENIAQISFRERYGKKMPKGFRLNEFELCIDRSVAEELDIQNKLVVNYDGSYNGRILYSLYDLKKGRNRNSEVFIKDGVAVYFRQSRYNSLTLTVRDANQYDLPEGQARIRRAYRKAMASKKKRLGTGRAGLERSHDPILMYEKNCSRYEESASVLYEKLIDQGYDNVWYVVNEDNPAIQELPEKYRKNLVWKDSDRHLELLFESDTYIATESTEHALQLRVASKLVMDKIRSRDLRYVFLQHGVMYMVSLNSDMRTGFRNNDHDLQRTVVSSELEARHFIDLAGMKREDLYVTGLAKFDRSFRNEGADRIIIMLTWRRWETNQARADVSETAYYKMTERIYNAVPDELKDKVIILPHPLMADRFAGGENGTEDSGMAAHIVTGQSYDRILRDCDLLITDYSSIAYDAFYRGANVVFCWEEKDECMQHYGEGTYLMLNRDNVFGDVCMNEEELRESVAANYGREQSEENKARYGRIVEFRDGRNSERIIELLKKDGLLD
ncbi:MAG: CDP-glycerol glycerophosphotransferase family protein [Mogibacterium sp.]|nr:CDP-glycerol glycerophosphotransferase family protein [Mogibacterium sp.]